MLLYLVGGAACRFLFPGFLGVALLNRLARRGRVGLGQDARDRTAQNPHAHIRGEIDLDLLGTHHFRHRAEKPAAGHDAIAAPQRIEHRAVVLLLLLLRPDQQEIEHDKDQDERQELYQGVLVHNSSSPILPGIMPAPIGSGVRPERGAPGGSRQAASGPRRPGRAPRSLVRPRRQKGNAWAFGALSGPPGAVIASASLFYPLGTCQRQLCAKPIFSPFCSASPMRLSGSRRPLLRSTISAPPTPSSGTPTAN